MHRAPHAGFLAVMEKDPVVQEIPVFLSHALSDNLFIHQYPSRPANRELKELNVINAAVKPKNRLFRIEVGLDTFSEKYSDSKGEEIAINTDGYPDSSRNSKDKNRERHFRSGVMDKIVYESTEPAPGIHHYALGILQDKELHCTPIKGIFNMNQVYTHLDKQDKNKKEKNKNESDDEAEDVEPEVQQVTVKFARQETEVAKKAREKSYEALTQRIASEPWHDSMWKHSDTDHADLERLKLFCGNTSDDTALPLTPAEYLRALCPPAPAGEPGPPNKHSLQDMIKDILLSARVLTYRGVRRALPRDARGEPALLSALGGAACCVRGVWTARSADLYARGAGRLPGAAMCAARDHVLYLLNHHPYVIREKVAAAVRLPPDEVLSILTSVAKYNPSTGWELLLPPDTEFEAKYPDVVQRQNLYLEALERQFNEMTVEESPPKRQRKKSQRDSDSMMSPKARCNSVSDEDDKKRHKSKSGTGKRTRNVSSSSAHEAT